MQQGEHVLIDNSGSLNNDIQVVGLPDGGFAVAYTDNGWGIDQTEITLVIFNANGSSRTGLIRVNEDTTGVQNNPSITVLSNGFIDVAFSSGGSLIHQAYTPNGARGRLQLYRRLAGVIEGEVTALGGGLVANVHSSTIPDSGGDNSIRSSVDELTRTTTGTGADETLNGDSLRDAIFGNGGNDNINGGGGFDTAVFSGPRSAFVVSNVGGSITITDTRGGSPDGTDTLTGVERLNFSNTAIPTAPTQNYRGDFNDDILWRDTTTGQISVWNLVGGAFNANSVLGGIGSNIQVAGNGDFNGDGVSDVLLRDTTTGSITNWTVSNGQFVASFTLGGVGSNIDVIGAGDFNGDGVSDVLLRDRTTGGVSDWQINANDSFNSSHQLGGISSNVDVVGAGDFNGDGVSDVLLRDRTTGAVSTWQINADNSFNSSHVIGGVPSTLDVIGAADFNGDGTSDILLRNRGTGEVSYWAVVNNTSRARRSSAACPATTRWQERAMSMATALLTCYFEIPRPARSAHSWSTTARSRASSISVAPG